jgi:hypothetical protein
VSDEFMLFAVFTREAGGRGFLISVIQNLLQKKL